MGRQRVAEFAKIPGPGLKRNFCKFRYDLSSAANPTLELFGT
jgi:hypothetical protein